MLSWAGQNMQEVYAAVIPQLAQQEEEKKKKKRDSITSLTLKSWQISGGQRTYPWTQSPL